MKKPLSLLFPFFLYSLSTLSNAQNFQFHGTYWTTGSGKSVEQVGLGIPATQMQAAFDTHTKDNLEMHLLDAYDVDSKVYFNFVFRARTSNDWVARYGLSAAQYQRAFDKNIDLGRCLRHLDVYRNTSNRIRYAAIFKSDSCVPQVAYHGVSPNEHQKKFDSLVEDGWDPINVSAVSVNGNRTFAAFYEKRTGSFSLRSFLTTDGVGEHDAKMAERGMRIVYMDAYTHDQGTFPRYAAIWRKVGKPSKAGHNLGGPQVHDLGDELHDAGRYVRYLTGFGFPPASHRYNLAVYKPRRASVLNNGAQTLQVR